MKKLFIVTGASGHLGGTIIRILAKTDCIIRGLLLPSDNAPEIYGAEYFRGDIRDIASLSELFSNIDGFEAYVIHTAGIVDISDRVTPTMYSVNVIGTKNMIAMCMRRGIKRLVYVSSVYAIPEKKSQAQVEVESFSPELVLGGYDLVDVRDVAQGCIDACEKGVSGEGYILSNRRYEIKHLLKLIKSDKGKKPLIVLPNRVAKALIPFLSLHAKRLKTRPLITNSSPHTHKKKPPITKFEKRTPR